MNILTFIEQQITAQSLLSKTSQEKFQAVVNTAKPIMVKALCTASPLPDWMEQGMFTKMVDKIVPVMVQQVFDALRKINKV